MKRQQAEAVLDRFFEEFGDTVPAQSDIEPVLDRVWERLEWKAAGAVRTESYDSCQYESETLSACQRQCAGDTGWDFNTAATGIGIVRGGGWLRILRVPGAVDF